MTILGSGFRFWATLYRVAQKSKPQSGIIIKSY